MPSAKMGNVMRARRATDALHAPGLKITPGITSDILFSTPGQYQITCTIHPSMNLTISVLGTGQVIGRPVAA